MIRNADVVAEGCRRLGSALIRQAVEDIKAWCQRRFVHGSNGDIPATRKEHTQKTAVRSMAWLCGIGRQRMPAQFVCDALRVDHGWLVSQVEEELAKLGVRNRFLKLKGMAIDWYGFSGGAE